MARPHLQACLVMMMMMMMSGEKTKLSSSASAFGITAPELGNSLPNDLLKVYNLLSDLQN